MRTHLHFNNRNTHLEHMARVRWDLAQMFTPPKSKSPWEAMTAGSTGGWAAPLQKFGAPLTAALGMIPGIGPLAAGIGGAAGMMGGGTGFQGTDKGWSNLFSVPVGAFGGYGMGGLGKGLAGAIGGGLKGGLGGVVPGFKGGIGQYFGTNIIPGMSGSNPTSWFGGANAIPTKYGSMMQPLYGGQPAATGSSAYMMSGGQPYTGAGQWTPSAVTQWLNKPGVAPTTGSAGNIPGVGNVTAQGFKGTEGTNWMKDIFGEKPGMTAAGLGVSALGALSNFGKGDIKVPKSEYWDEYTSRLVGDTPLKSAATTEMMNIMQRPEPGFNPVSDEMYDAAIRRNKEMEVEAEKSLRTEYKGIRPGANVEGDSGFRQDLLKMRDKFAKERMAINTELAYNREREYNARIDDFYKTKSNYLVNVLKLDQDTINQYAQMAQMDTARLMAETGLKAGEAANFKSLFGDIGKYLMQQGTGMNWQNYYNQALGMGGAG